MIHNIVENFSTSALSALSRHGDVILGTLVLVLVSMNRGGMYDTKLSQYACIQITLIWEIWKWVVTSTL